MFWLFPFTKETRYRSVHRQQNQDSKIGSLSAPEAPVLPLLFCWLPVIKTKGRSNSESEAVWYKALKERLYAGPLHNSRGGREGTGAVRREPGPTTFAWSQVHTSNTSEALWVVLCDYPMWGTKDVFLGEKVRGPWHRLRRKQEIKNGYFIQFEQVLFHS